MEPESAKEKISGSSNDVHHEYKRHGPTSGSLYHDKILLMIWEVSVLTQLVTVVSYVVHFAAFSFAVFHNDSRQGHVVLFVMFSI